MIYLHCSTVMHPVPLLRTTKTSTIIITILLSILLLSPSLVLLAVAQDDLSATTAPNDDLTRLFGLPRYNHCAFASNNSFYVFGGSHQSLSSSITTTTTTATSSSSSSLEDNNPVRLNFTPSINTRPTIDQLVDSQQPALNDIALGAGCAVTSYGHALFLPPHGALLTYNLLTHQWTTNNAVQQGSPAALASFNGTSSSRRREMASAMWNDMWIIFGGRVDNSNSFTQNTFILDARMPSPWIWFESPITLNTPPAPSSLQSPGTMVATSRWVLYFAITTTTSNGNATAEAIPFSTRPYNVAVHCFDPYVLLWVGQVANFTASTDHLHAVSFDLDSVLVVPAYSPSSSPSNTTTFTNNNISNNYNSGGESPLAVVLPPQGLWRLDMSRDTAAGTVNWIGDAGPFRPLQGGTVTRLTDDLIVLYGGTPFSHDSLRFWNTTAGSFIDPAWWRETHWNTRPSGDGPTTTAANNEGVGPNILAIVLGTVLGFLGLVLLILASYYFCCYRRRRRRKEDAKKSTSRQMRARSATPISIRTNLSSSLRRGPAGLFSSMENDNNSNNRNLSTATVGQEEEDAGTWAAQLRRTLSAVAHNNRVRWSRSPQAPQDMASPVSPLSDRPMLSSSPVNGDAAPVGAASGAAVIAGNNYHNDTNSNNAPGVINTERQRRIRESSRFSEHFDLLAPPGSVRLSQLMEEDVEP